MGAQEMYTAFWRGNLLENAHLLDQGGLMW